MMSTALDHEPSTESDPGPKRPRWVWLVAVLAVVVVATAGGAYYLKTHQSPAREDVAKDPALAGQDETRAPMSTTRTSVFVGTEPDTARLYEAWLGKKVDYIVDFPTRDNWDQIANPAQTLSAWKDSGFTPVYSIAMLPDQDQSATIEQGATGAYDQYYTQLAQNLINANQANAVLRIGWEFNLSSSRWHSDDEQAWITYFRRIVTAMRAVPGEQFTFDWNPNNGKNPYDAVKYYPGDQYVDYVGVDAYDVGYVHDTYPYPDNCDDTCRLTRQQNAWAGSIYGGSRGLKFWSRFAAHHGKPMSLPEWGLWTRQDGHGGGNDTYYLQQMHAFITDPANGVAYQSYFEFDGADGTHRLTNDDFPGAGDVFKRLFVSGS